MIISFYRASAQQHAMQMPVLG